MTKQDTKQINARLPLLTWEQIQELEAKTGMTITQIIIMAIDRLYKEEVEQDED